MNNLWRSCFVAAVAISLAACADASSTDGDSAVASEMMGLTADLPPNTVPDVYQATHTPGSGEFVGALVDISAHTCELQPDGWRVAGTATNPTGDAVDYRIYVSLLNGVSATRALVEAEVLAVAAGDAGTFDVLIPIPDDDLRCVLRVERRAPGA